MVAWIALHRVPDGPLRCVGAFKIPTFHAIRLRLVVLARYQSGHPNRCLKVTGLALLRHEKEFFTGKGLSCRYLWTTYGHGKKCRYGQRPNAYEHK